MFGKLTVIKVYCQDLDAMTAFYRDRLGLEVREEYPGVSVVFDTGHGGELIVQQGAEPTAIAFTQVDIPAAHRALEDLGTTEVFPHKTGERFEAADPEGNRLIFVNA
ncbi:MULTISPECIES: VOC family protein [unclassified Streptomyces]|uniref:VOC family protein n=1 Tax=unclassified Streptomyces TaxID=2593676 RepID=UPI00278C2CED|nr:MULTISPECIES: VOC family protein [unclassified Streptomyces]